MAATRIFDGVRFTHQGNSRWLSEDGRFSIEQDDENTTFCEEAHPVRVTAKLANSVREAPQLWCVDAQLAVRTGARGYLCPGGEEHSYTTWHVWDNEAGDYLDHETIFADFSAAASFFVRWHSQQP